MKIASKMPAPSRVGERLACRELVDAALSNIDGSEQKVGVLIDSVTDWLSTQESPIAIPVLINSLLEFTDRGVFSFHVSLLISVAIVILQVCVSPALIITDVFLTLK